MLSERCHDGTGKSLSHCTVTDIGGEVKNVDLPMFLLSDKSDMVSERCSCLLRIFGFTRRSYYTHDTDYPLLYVVSLGICRQ